jgi:hypothetical protein
MSQLDKKLYMDPEQYRDMRLDLRDDDLRGTQDYVKFWESMGYHGDVEIIVTPDGGPLKVKP